MNTEDMTEEELRISQEREDECMACHPYAVRGAALEEERAKRELEKENGRIYNPIHFRGKGEEYGGWDLTLPKLHAANPTLKAILEAKVFDGYTLTVSKCGLMPDLIEEAHYGRPMWVMHMPGLPSSHIHGESTNFGVAENPIRVRVYADADGGAPRMYLSWGLWKWEQILVPVDDVFESLKDADDGEGRIVIAFVGGEDCTVCRRWIPVGLLSFIESCRDGQLNDVLGKPRTLDSSSCRIMTVQYFAHGRIEGDAPGSLDRGVVSE